MKKVVLTMALVAMMSVSCKDQAAADAAATETTELTEAVDTAAAAVDTAAAAVDTAAAAAATEAPATEEVKK